jgi:hypothetical protein
MGVTLLSISSDGRYVVGNYKTDLILWDIEKRKRRRVAKKVNIFSAYFIKNSPYYMYQDLENIVHVKHIDGSEVKTIPLDFPTYGHVMTTDLSRYFASDIDWGIVKVQDGEQSIVKPIDDSGGKLLNLFLSSDDSTLLSSGFSGGGREEKDDPLFTKDEIPKMIWTRTLSSITLWDAHTSEPLYLYRMPNYKTSAVISPDRRYIIGVDEAGWMLKLNLQTNNYFITLNTRDSVFVIKNNDRENAEDLAKPPEKVNDEEMNKLHTNHGLRGLYITDKDYLMFYAYSPYVSLYNQENLVPLAQFSLGTEPFSSVGLYMRNASLDTAPNVHRLVTGKRNERGIMVYDYDPANQSLTKIWDSK